MFISKLRLSGFKSFSDDTTITIGTGLNGIIGPNGSGKSNIVEAIKWVMGENSSKSLRGSGMNDLIFSGSASKASKNIALVSLKIEVDKTSINENNKKFLKDGIIEVERQILRDSGSTYRINGKEVRAKDIQFLFADFSSGSRSSNIIDQGSVGNLVLQKPIERRKILDEAAGVSGISARKNETLNKLEATKRNIERLKDILNTKKSDLSELLKQANKAKIYKDSIKKISELKETLEISKWKKSKIELENIKKQFINNKELLEKHKKKINVLEKLILEENVKLKEIESHRKKLDEANLMLNLDIEKINFELTNKKNELDSLLNLEEQIKKNISFQNEILNNATLRLKEISNEIKGIELEEKKSKNKDESFTAITEYQSKNNLLDEKIYKLNSDLNNEKYNVSQFEFEISVLEKKKIELTNDMDITKNQINEKKSCLNKSSKITFLKKAIDNNKVRIDNINKSLENINYESSKRKDTLQTLYEKFKKANFLQEEYKQNINNIEKKISSYISLGLKKTSKSILNEIKIANGYRLAFCLAIGDGIEADKGNDSNVKWENIDSKEIYNLPKGLNSLEKYVKGPVKLKKFLSQVAVVESIKEGNKFHRFLKNGQIAVTKEGSLWRWDGLIILNGKETFTYKRIDSTTKILELEKLLNKENNKFSKINNEISEHKGKINKENDKLKSLEENFLILNNELQEKLKELNEADKSIFIEKNSKDNIENDILKLEDYLAEVISKLDKAKNEINLLNEKISKKSSKILRIRKEISENKINLLNIKKNLDQLQISYAIKKQKDSAEKLKYTKNIEEIKETEKKIIITKDTVNTLYADLNEVVEKIKNYKLNPITSNQGKDKLQNKILFNKKSIKELEIKIIKYNAKISSLLENNSIQKNKLESLKEVSIRKDTQINELSNFLQIKSDQIKNDLDVDVNFLSDKILFDNKYDVNIKDAENILRKLKLKNDEYSNVNLSAEKDALVLEKKVEELSLEEKDLSRAAKKLERAIEELNKESRNRILNSFEEINSAFAKIFKKLFNGGKAYLQLVDSSDPLEAGLELMVSPPGKKLQKLSLLSGGEKALASLALIFSTFINKTSPICILDEVDAPLDDTNVEKFCELLKEATNISKKRFLIITHNRITMGYMNKLYGITMIEPGSSKIVSVDLDKAESVYAAE